MKVIIMAAGTGTRLGKLNQNKPKCLIKIHGETLLARVVRLLRHKGLTDITVIVGYEGELIKQELGDSVKYYDNPFYSVTNSIASLWLARHEIHDEVILMNADLFFEERLLDAVLDLQNPVTLLSDSSRQTEADYRFGFEGDLICRYGKQLTPEETDGEYVGIARVNHDFIKLFKQRLENMIQAHQFHEWWEDVIYSHIDDGFSVYHKDIAGLFWTEVDCLEDFERLLDWEKANAKPRLSVVTSALKQTKAAG